MLSDDKLAEPAARERERAWRREEAGRALRQRARDLLGQLQRRLPGLAVHAAHAMRNLRVEESPSIASIAADGTITLDLGQCQSLHDDELLYVLAHELMHRSRLSHERSCPELRRPMNLAQDAVINDVLDHAKIGRRPRGAVRHSGARVRSAEALIVDVDGPPRAYEDIDLVGKQDAPLRGPGGELVTSVGIGSGDGGIRASSHIFPRSRAIAAIERGIAEPVRVAGCVEADDVAPMDALDLLAGTGSTHRSWSRPSRRAGGANTWLRPGRFGGMPPLRVLLDTSGSMIPHLEQALGLVRATARALGRDVLLVECDRSFVRARELTADDLDAVELLGTTEIESILLSLVCTCERRHTFLVDEVLGSLDEGFAYLDDQSDAPVLVVTDAWILPPEREPTFPVVWALVGEKGWKPTFGEVGWQEGAVPGMG